MLTIPIYTPAGEQAGEFELASELFEVETNEALVHQAVVATLANQRQGSADTKTRGEVSHTTRKVYRQKGTGRARQGMRSAPHWKGGGVVFGPHPRDFHQDLPKKMRRKALLCALSAKAADNAIVVVDDFAFADGKTKEAVALLKALELDTARVLVVMDAITDTTVRAFRNLPNVLLTTSAGLGTYDVLNAHRLLFTRASLELLQELKQRPLGSEQWIAKQGAEA